MGCFSVPKSRRSVEELPPTLKTLLEDKQSILPPARWIGDKNYTLLGISPSFRAKAKVIQSVSRFVKNQPRALSAPAIFHSMPDSSEGEHSQSNGLESVSHSGPITAACATRSGGTCGTTESRRSGPFPNKKGPAFLPQANNPLFPLPLPPEEVSSQSVSSTGSISSSSGASSSACPTTNAVVAFARAPIVSNGMVSSVWGTYTSEPMPLPTPPDSVAALREFSFEELAGACQNFSTDFWIKDGGAGPVYRAIVKSDSDDEKLEVAITRISGAGCLSLRKWRAEVNSLVRMSHPHLCKVIGFCAEDPTSKTISSERERLLVYENTPNGSLDSLLYGRMDRAPMDWPGRMRVALGAAQGLAYLHERTPKQIVYISFKTINIQVDQSFNAKLSDYGFARINSKRHNADSLSLVKSDDPYLAPETRAKNLLSDKSNVWSFGVVLLELLTGRQHMDEIFSHEERCLVQWVKPYLMDVKRLYLVMDPELKGRYPTKSAKIVADLALQFVNEDPAQRPSMRSAVDKLKYVQSSKFTKPGIPVIDPIMKKSKSINSSFQTSHPHRYLGKTNGETNATTDPIWSSKMTLVPLSSSCATTSEAVTANCMPISQSTG